MSPDFLEFEKPIAELQEKIAELQRVSASGELSFDKEINMLKARSMDLTRDIFSKLDAWQITQLSRHPMRPYTLDYIDRIVDDFQELHGDRMYSDDPAIVAGLGYLGEYRVVVIGHQKGRDTKERAYRHFGMSRPEGYRKAQRVMELAARFGLPIVTLIDTPGAYPGVGAEERGQSQAIARSIELMTMLETPIVSVVIGEGGSGGALAIGVADRLLMMEYATYSVISPEGCASILWKSSKKAPSAAAAMSTTSSDLLKLGLIDEVIPEPLGGAHQNYDVIAQTLKSAVITAIETIRQNGGHRYTQHRYARLMNYGVFERGK